MVAPEMVAPVDGSSSCPFDASNEVAKCRTDRYRCTVVPRCAGEPGSAQDLRLALGRLRLCTPLAHQERNNLSHRRRSSDRPRQRQSQRQVALHLVALQTPVGTTTAVT